MKRKFNAREMKAIQRYAIEHELIETKCYYPTAQFKNPDDKSNISIPIQDLMTIDHFERREERRNNKKARAERRKLAEEKL